MRIQSEYEGDEYLKFSRVFSKYTGTNKARVRKKIIIPEGVFESVNKHKEQNLKNLI